MDENKDPRVNRMAQKRPGSPERANWIRIQSRDAERSASIAGSQAGASQDRVPEGSAGEQSFSPGPQLVAPIPPTQRDGLASFTTPPTERDVKIMESFQAGKDFVNWHATAYKVWRYCNRAALLKLRCTANSAELSAELSYQWSKLSEEEKRPYCEVAHKLNVRQKQKLPECEPKNKRSCENLNSGYGAGQRESQAAGHEVQQAAGFPPPQAAGFPPPQAAGHQASTAAGSTPSQAVGCAAASHAAGHVSSQATQTAASRAIKRAAERYAASQAAGYQPLQVTAYQPLQVTAYQPSQAAGYQPSQAAGYQPSQVTAYQPSQAAGYQPSQVTAYQPSQAAGYQPSQVAGSAADKQVYQSSFFMSQAVPPVPSSLYYPSMYPVFPIMPYALDCYSCPPFYLPDQHSWAEPRLSSLYNRHPSASQSLQGGWNTRLLYMPQPGPSSQIAERSASPSDVSQQVAGSATATLEPQPVTAEETESSFREEIDVIGL